MYLASQVHLPIAEHLVVTAGGTWYPNPFTLDPGPFTLHPGTQSLPLTLDPGTCTLDPAPESHGHA